MKLSACIAANVALICLAQAAWAAQSDHALDLGFRWNHINSTSDKTFDIYAPSLGYTFYWVNPFGIIVNVETSWPITGSQDGTSFSLTDTYESGLFGGDITVEAAWATSLAQDLDVVLGAGLHFNGIMLEGTEVLDWYSATMGMGASALIRAHVSRLVSVGGNLHTGWDFIDFIHGGDLGLAFTLGVSATVGVHFE